MRTLDPRVAAVIAVLAAAAGCSSSSPTQPTGVSSNLPAAAPPGTSQTADTVDSLTIKGRVTDAQTQMGLGKVTILVRQVQAAAPTLPPPGLATPSLGATGSATSSFAPPPAAPSPGASSSVQTLKHPIEVKADKHGDFEVKDLPPGTYSLTAYKPGYEAETFVGGRPASGQVDLVLVPNGTPTGYELTGKVLLLNHKPAVGVHVAAALQPGLFASTAAITDANGNFTLDGLPSGDLTLASWETGDAGEIKAWGYAKDVAVAMGKDKRIAHPEITLHAVEHPIILAGKVSSNSSAIKPRQVQVLLETSASADIPLIARAPDQDGYFRFSVPAPEDTTSYHLLASGTDEHGDVSYAHLHDLAGPSHADDLVLPELPATPSMQVDAHTTWSWQPLGDVSAYRVRLESTGDNAATLWEGWTTGTSLTFPDIPGLEFLKGDKYRFSLTAIKADGAFELPEIGLAQWDAAASLAPREFVAGEKIQETAQAPASGPTLGEEEAAPPDAQVGAPSAAGPAAPGAPPMPPVVPPAPHRQGGAPAARRVTQ